MTPNAQQQRAVKALSSRIYQLALSCRYDGSMAFNLKHVPGTNSFVFSATNVLGSLRWFETPHSYYAVIGARGGVRQYDGDI